MLLLNTVMNQQPLGLCFQTDHATVDIYCSTYMAWRNIEGAILYRPQRLSYVIASKLGAKRYAALTCWRSVSDTDAACSAGVSAPALSLPCADQEWSVQGDWTGGGLWEAGYGGLG